MLQIRLPSHEPHVMIPVEALQRALERQSVRTAISPLRIRLWRGLAKVASWLGIRRLRASRSSEPVFFHLNHPWLNALYPYCLTHPCVTYSFDCWPGQYENWERFFKRNCVRAAFISARQSAAEMARRCEAVEF